MVNNLSEPVAAILSLNGKYTMRHWRRRLVAFSPTEAGHYRYLIEHVRLFVCGMIK